MEDAHQPPTRAKKTETERQDMKQAALTDLLKCHVIMAAGVLGHDREVQVGAPKHFDESPRL